MDVKEVEEEEEGWSRRWWSGGTIRIALRKNKK